MELKELNPNNLADPNAAALRPAIHAAMEALTTALKAAQLDAHYVLMLSVPDSAPDATADYTQVASNLMPDEARAFLRSIANEGEAVMPVQMAYELANLIARTGRLPPITPATFNKLMGKVAAMKTAAVPKH